MNVKIENTKVFIDDKITNFKRLSRKFGRRMIFQDQNNILKCDRGAIAKEQTKKEIILWNNHIEPDDKKYFAPILEYELIDQESWALYRKYNIVKVGFISGSSIELEKYVDIVRKLIEKYKIYDSGYGNWGITEENKLIIFDYGL